jgi:hypothetical protein
MLAYLGLLALVLVVAFMAHIRGLLSSGRGRRPDNVTRTAGKPLEALYVNHISYQVNDYAKCRDFYAGLLGMKVTEDDGKQCRLVFGTNILIPAFKLFDR